MKKLSQLLGFLLIVYQLGDSARAAYDELVSLMVLTGFIPYLYIFASAWKAGKRLSAASGLAITALAVFSSVIPPTEVTHTWLFEGKLAAGTLAVVASGAVIYSRRKIIDTPSRLISRQVPIRQVLISTDCVCDASLVPGTCPERFPDLIGLINKFLESQEMFVPVRTWEVTALGRSRPAADAAREVAERWLLDGLNINVGHRRCSRDPSQKNDAGRTPAS